MCRLFPLPRVSERALAPRRWQNPHHLAILRNRSAGDVHSLAPEGFGYRLVGERVLAVFLVDELADPLLHALGRDVLARPAAEARGEEELELERPLRGVNVLVGGRTAHGRLVHADVARDVPEHQRTEAGNTAFEEVPLE